MSSQTSHCLNDDSFGPAVIGCRSDFDFTLVFERTILTIGPSSCFILLSLARITQLAHHNEVVSGTKLRALKQIAITVYVALNFSILILVCKAMHFARTSSIAASSLTVVASLVMLVLSWTEHGRALRTSFLLNTYLFITILLDMAQCRTLFLRDDTSSIGELFATALAVKAFILLLESYSKSRWYKVKSETRSAEETSGLFSLCAFFWLTSLISQGHQRLLGLEDLPPLDGSLSAQNQQPRFEAAWNRSSRHGRTRLISALANSAGPRGLYPVLPRVMHIGFAFCQPFLIQGVSRYLQSPANAASANPGYGWVCVAFLAYSGMAITSSLYWYHHQRVLARLRADLVSNIFRQTICLGLSHGEKSITLTLMSTDVERIQRGMQNIHEVWANAIEVGLAAWLLQRQIGIAFLVPLAYIVLCVAISLALGKISVPRQGAWMAAIQKRVGTVSSIITGMKSLRMMGLSTQLADTVEQQRNAELQSANQARLIIVLGAVVGFSPLLLSPVLTFAATGRILDTNRLFTSLAFLLLVSNPLAQLLQIIPQTIGTLACFDRVAEFLEIVTHVDTRVFPPNDGLVRSPSPTESRISNSKECVGLETIKSIQNEDIDTIDLEGIKDRSPQPAPAIASSNVQVPRPGALESSIIMQDLNFGWDAEKFILRDITLSIPLSKTTVILGPVGSGKSTLCKALLGEISPSTGVIHFPCTASSTAFCDQAAWLPNGTIRACILGYSHVDEEWYSTVLGATELPHDLDQLPNRDLTLIGSSGVMLSGGQKLRVALARALYTRATIVVLDDIFSGLDKATETQICENLFGKDGLFCFYGMTVILVSHNPRHVHFADHIIALSSGGTVVEAGSLSELQRDPKYVASLTTGDRGEVPSPNPRSREAKAETKIQRIPKAEAEDWSRQTGDLAIYRYYFSMFGSAYIMYFLLTCSAVGFSFNFNTVWLKYWSDHNVAHPANDRKDYYLGIYATIQICALISLGLFVQHNNMRMAVKMGILLHRKALLTVMSASLDFFTRTDVGTTVNRFSQDMTIVDGQLALGLSNTAVTTFVVLGQAIVIALASPYLAISYPFLLIILYFIQKVYLRTSRQLRFLDLESKAPLYTHFIETAAGLATIRAFGWSNASIKKNDELLDASQKPAYLLAMVQQWLQTVLHWTVTGLATVLIALATQLRSSAGFTSVGLISLMSIGNFLSAIIINWTALETSIGAVSRLKTFSEDVESEDLPGEDQQCPLLWPQNGALEIQSITASYSEMDAPATRHALNNISLSIKAGEKVAIIGRTGSGKSSLILLLLRLLNPTLSESSHMTIDDLSLTKLNRRTIRERLIAIPQDSFIIEHLTWQENLEPSKSSTIEECERVLQDVNLRDAIRSTGGLEALSKPDILSHGQKQLFGLARAVLKGRLKRRLALGIHGLQGKTGKSEKGNIGGLLLLDEIASSVDENTEKIMHEIILREFAGYTILAVAHRIESVRAFDTVVIMADGKIEGKGPAEEMLGRVSPIDLAKTQP